MLDFKKVDLVSIKVTTLCNIEKDIKFSRINDIITVW